MVRLAFLALAPVALALRPGARAPGRPRTAVASTMEPPAAETWEPPEFEANRKKARARQLRYSPKDKKGDARRTLLEAQRLFKTKPPRPAFLDLVPEASLENATVGAWHAGVVRSLKPHGAWVSIGAEVDGFVHCRDMSATDFVDDPAKLLRVGQAVDACVKAADATKRVLSLSLLQVEPPKEGLLRVADFSVDQKLENVVVERVTPYAAFVDVGAAVPAYLHVADIGLLPRTKIGAARIPRLRLEAPGQVIDECWVKAVDIGRDRLRLTLVPLEDRDDPTLYGRRSGPEDDADEGDEMPGLWD